MEKFSEMKYVRPDGEAYIRTIQKETKNFNEAADFEGAHQAFVAILNANSHFNTTRVMASIREKRIMNAFMLTVILAAIVAVVYSLHENPTVLISILYIGGILAGIHVWNKKK